MKTKQKSIAVRATTRPKICVYDVNCGRSEHNIRELHTRVILNEPVLLYADDNHDVDECRWMSFTKGCVSMPV